MSTAGTRAWGLSKLDPTASSFWDSSTPAGSHLPYWLNQVLALVVQQMGVCCNPISG